MKVLQFLFLVIIISIIDCASLKWNLINITANTPPSGRRDHALGYDGANDRLVLFGGRGGNGVFSDTWIFDFQNSSWRQINTSPSPEGRFSMVYGVSNGYFYISSGQQGSTLFSDLWRFDISNEMWTKMNSTGKAPEVRYGSTGGFYTNSSNEFYFTHGFSFTTRYSNTFIYDVSEDRWTEILPSKNAYHFNRPSPRCLHGGAMVGPNQHLIYGGCLSGGGSGGACPGLDSWLLTAKKWKHMSECASPRQYPSVALLPTNNDQRRAVLYGGQEDSNQVLINDPAERDQVAIFNVNTEEWSLRRVDGNPPQKRAGASLISHPQGLILFGGNDFNDLWMLAGDTVSADETPLHSQECKKPFAGTLNLVMLHGVFMVIGWGILLQAGAFIARYLRFKDPLWFHLHRLCQVSGLIFSLAGFACAVASVQFDHFKFGHGGLGLFIMLIGIQQPFNALIRPHKEKGEKVSTKRKIWEICHINIGRLALLLTFVEIPLGLFQAQAHNGHHTAWYVCFGLFVLTYIIFEARLQYKRYNSSSSKVEIEMRQ